MTVTLYKADVSPPSRTCLMIAEIINLKFKTEEVNCVVGETKAPAFIEKNPLHTIPVLEDRDLIITDSHVIITYLVSKYGADKKETLYPSALALRAIVEQRLYFNATVLFPPLKLIIREILYKGSTGPNKKQIKDVNEAYAILEKYLEKSKYVAGNNLTVADVSCVSTVSSLEMVVPIDGKYKKVHAWFNRVKEEVWYQNANVPGLTQLDKHLKMTIQKNTSIFLGFRFKKIFKF